MTEGQPQRARVRVEEPKAEPDPARTGCLWVGGILGVVVGVAVTFLAVPSILNFLFPSETIEVGETYEDDKLTLEVTGIRVTRQPDVPPTDPPRMRTIFVLTLSVDANSSWNTRYENFVLVLDNGKETDATPLGTDAISPIRVPQGEGEVELAFRFPLDESGEPESLHLEEPPVKFLLPKLATP